MLRFLAGALQWPILVNIGSSVTKLGWIMHFLKLIHSACFDVRSEPTVLDARGRKKHLKQVTC